VKQNEQSEEKVEEENWLSKRIVISTSNTIYQIWKIFNIILSFVSCFDFAYAAAFFD
jgi:hypothetical protein